MKSVLPITAAVALTLSACGSKDAEETPVSTSEAIEETTNATDVAETTAVPLDTNGLAQDTSATNS